jgi:hypothetical protein
MKIYYILARRIKVNYVRKASHVDEMPCSQVGDYEYDFSGMLCCVVCYKLAGLHGAASQKTLHKLAKHVDRVASKQQR